MPALRDLIVATSRLLARRVEELRDKLEWLTGQLRATVAQAVGEAVGSTVRDAIEHALDRVMGQRATSGFTPRRQWDEPQRFEEDDRSNDDPWFEDDDDMSASNPRTEEPDTRWALQRWLMAISTGLQTVLWWLRHGPARRGAMVALAIGLLACVVAFLAPTLAAVGLGLLGSAGQIRVFLDALRHVRIT